MTPDIFVNKWAKMALHFLVFSAIAGMVLRYYNFKPILGLNYKFLLHTNGARPVNFNRGVFFGNI